MHPVIFCTMDNGMQWKAWMLIFFHKLMTLSKFGLFLMVRTQFAEKINGIGDTQLN